MSHCLPKTLPPGTKAVTPVVQSLNLGPLQCGSGNIAQVLPDKLCQYVPLAIFCLVTWHLRQEHAVVVISLFSGWLVKPSRLYGWLDI